MYVVGDLNNALMLLDEFFVYLAEKMAKEKSFDVHITPHTGVELDDIFDDLLYDNYTLQEPTASPPLRIFEATFWGEMHSYASA